MWVKSGISGKSGMPSRLRSASKPGYTLDRVTIRDLFQGGATREPSEKALRARADRKQAILVFVESVGNTHFYDRVLSTIRMNAARRCKGPGVKWSDIVDCLQKVTLNNGRLKDMLNDGGTVAEATDALAVELSAMLDRR
jgi:hypothetical protein